MLRLVQLGMCRRTLDFCFSPDPLVHESNHLEGAAAELRLTLGTSVWSGGRGGLAFQIELILGKPAQQLRLAHTRIPNKYNFEQEVVLL